MIRLFTPEKLSAGQALCATDKQIHYLLHVMRLKAGEKILLFNGQDGEFECEILELTKKSGRFKPLCQTREQIADGKGALAVSLIKKDNMDLVLQKATELGVKKIYPIIATRSVIQKFNMERARLVVTEAAEQCERLTLPEISEPMDLKTFLNKRLAVEKLVYLAERGQTNGRVNRLDNVCFIVGPEGGWTREELTILKSQKNACSLNLGRLILRAETASIAVLAAYRFDVFDS